MLNKMQVIGFAGSDPEMRYTPSGSAVTNFSVAVNRRYRDSFGKNQEETEWFRVVCWNELAEVINNYVAKGGKYYVEGRLRSNQWVGQDGQNRFTNEIVASTVVFLDPARNNGQQAAGDYAYGGGANGNANLNGHGPEPVGVPADMNNQPNAEVDPDTGLPW